jgi:hypothetical protein
VGVFKRLLGISEKTPDSGWTGKSRSTLRKARIVGESGGEVQIRCNNGACPDVSFFVSKGVTSGTCRRCNTPWRI